MTLFFYESVRKAHSQYIMDEVNTLRQEKQQQRLILVFFINDEHSPELTVIQILIWR
jgi:hypothetical protein